MVEIAFFVGIVCSRIKRILYLLAIASLEFEVRVSNHLAMLIVRETLNEFLSIILGILPSSLSRIELEHIIV